MTIASPSAETSALARPCVESYFSRYARFSAGTRSLIPTNSMSLSSIAARKTRRPIRPNPLMPTFRAIAKLLAVVEKTPPHAGVELQGQVLA